MNKYELREKLTTLSPTEQACKTNVNISGEYDFPYFNYVLDSQNRQIYTYTFERHLQKSLKRTPHIARYLEKLPLLIFKHARFSFTPFHVHDFVEMTYVYKGTINMIINDHQVTLQQGYVCILDTDVSHKILDTSEDDILINFLMNKKYFSNKMLSRLGSNNIISRFAVESISETHDHNQYIIFNTNNSELLMDAVEGLLSNYFDSTYYSVDTIDAYMIIIFSELIKAHQNEKSIEYQKSNHMYIIDILQYIENNYSTCTLESLANKFGYNPSYLSRYIKKSTGQTFIELIQELRLNQACFMLKNSTVSIEYIIQTVGYKNVAFFYKKFNALFGMSPKEYRDS
ncbi:AraC family transcriptional regulator [Niallia taxi]|nr:AraC family transcriptional regulator [Niallia taxi]